MPTALSITSEMRREQCIDMMRLIVSIYRRHNAMCYFELWFWGDFILGLFRLKGWPQAGRVWFSSYIFHVATWVLTISENLRSIFVILWPYDGDKFSMIILLLQFLRIEMLEITRINIKQSKYVAWSQALGYLRKFHAPQAHQLGKSSHWHRSPARCRGNIKTTRVLSSKPEPGPNET